MYAVILVGWFVESVDYWSLGDRIGGMRLFTSMKEKRWSGLVFCFVMTFCFRSVGWLVET